MISLRIVGDCCREWASRWRYDFVCHALRNIMGCPNGQDIVVVGTFDRQTWRRVTGAQPNRFRKEGAMLSTTVEPECRQRPFVISYAMTGPRGGVAADIAPRTAIGRADDAPAREATKALAHATIHPAADRVEAYRRHRTGQFARGAPKGLLSNGFRDLSAGDQLPSNVYRAGGGADADRRTGLARAGRRTAFGGQLISVGGFGPDRRAVAGACISVDGCRRGDLRHLAERHRRASRGNRRASQGRSRRLPNGVHVDRAAADGGR